MGRVPPESTREADTFPMETFLAVLADSIMATIHTSTLRGLLLQELQWRLATTRPDESQEQYTMLQMVAARVVREVVEREKAA